MADLSINAEHKYLLNGKPFNAPLEWEDITIEADYIDDSVQPSLTVDQFVFPLEAREAINQWIEDGLTGGVGIFEGMPFQLTLFNNQPAQENFKAFIDFTSDYNDLLEDGLVNVSIIKDKGLDSFFEQIRGTTFGYLESIGAVGVGDYITVDYVVEKKFNMFEILMSSIVLYIMIKTLADSVKSTSESIATASGIFAAGFTGSIGSAIYLVAKALIEIIYTAILLLAIIELTITLVNTLVPPKRKHKAITLKRALEVVATHFGYTLVTSISELDYIVYQPSNPNLDEKTAFGFISVVKGTQKGIPNTLDLGYNCWDMFDLAKKLFNGKYAIIDNNIHFRSENDPFWIQQSTWELPDVLIESKRYNTDEMRADRVLSFSTDLNDEWTIDNFGGTSFEVRTEEITRIRKRAVLIKGLDEVNFNVALGNRKDSLNAIENLLLVVANFIDDVTSIFGGGTNFASQIKTKIGVLKQSSNWHSIPKIIYLTSGKIPVNHRSLWNAQILYNKYHKEKSFVLDNWRNQKVVYKDVGIPFGLEDYKQLTNNPYFLFNNNDAKITKFTWLTGRDRATISFWVRKQYTSNLKEININPS